MRAPQGGGCLPNLGALSLVPLPIFTAFVVGWPLLWPIGAALLATEWGWTQDPGPILVGDLALPSQLAGVTCGARDSTPIRGEPRMVPEQTQLLKGFRPSSGRLPGGGGLTRGAGPRCGRLSPPVALL